MILIIPAFSRGQLGHGDTENQSEPRVVEDLEAVTMIAVCAGGWHSAALSGTYSQDPGHCQTHAKLIPCPSKVHARTMPMPGSGHARSKPTLDTGYTRPRHMPDPWLCQTQAHATPTPFQTHTIPDPHHSRPTPFQTQVMHGQVIPDPYLKVEHTNHTHCHDCTVPKLPKCVHVWNAVAQW